MNIQLKYFYNNFIVNIFYTIDMSTHRLLFQWASTIKIQLSMLV
jgi:hypothetical protein